MVSTTALISIGTIIFSFMIGILFYYLIVSDTKEIKKQCIDQALSHLINFVLFIWAGKIILHINRFISDPFAVLAYPSDANAFYIATLLFSGTIAYQVMRGKLDGVSLLNTFIPIFISALFTYEFLQWTVHGENQAIIQLTCSAVLLVIYFLLLEKMNVTKSNLLTIMLWIMVQAFIAIRNTYSIVFGYSISIYFFLILFILVFIYFVYSNRSRSI